MIDQNSLENGEFGTAESLKSEAFCREQAPQNFCSEGASIAVGHGADEKKNADCFAVNPTQFGIGTLHMGALLDPASSRKIVLTAIDSGISFFDTAPLYGNGFAEEILGNILSEVRQSVSISTKAGLSISKRRDGRFGVAVARLTAEMLRQSVEQSLKRLKREAVEVLQLHAYDSHTPLEETLRALTALYSEGKIRSFGCSNYNPQQLKLLLKTLKGEIPFAAAQCHYNMIERRAERGFIPLCEKYRVPIVINRALARGALTGQYGEGSPFPENSRASISPRLQKWLTPTKLKLLSLLAKISLESGTSLMAVSIKWFFKKNFPMILLLGVRSEKQLKHCLEIGSTEISEAVFEKIEAILQSEQNVYQFPPRYFER